MFWRTYSISAIESTRHRLRSILAQLRAFSEPARVLDAAGQGQVQGGKKNKNYENTHADRQG